MKNPFIKQFSWAIAFSITLTVSTCFVLLDTFVITRAGTSGAVIFSMPDSSSETTTSSSESSSASVSESSTSVSSSSASFSVATVITSNSYSDANIQITIDTVRAYSTQVYIADIQVSNYAYLRTAFARNTYGRNYTEKASSMATSHGGLLAINGDYYGFRSTGFVVRNGVLYRSSVNQENSGQALVLDGSGDMHVVSETNTSTTALAQLQAWQAWSFGPQLMGNGNILVDANIEISSTSSPSNPRTAMGQISPLHYVFIVSDGRTSESDGLSLLELAQQFDSRGCTLAYNLDGGGSATMWFNGRIVNKPVNSGSTISERAVSDCVYIGYQ